jgi:putative membrane protein
LSVADASGAPGRGGGEGVRIRDHLANVRTFLAWLRTGLVLLALGYTLAKFEVIAHASSHYVGVLAAACGWLVVVLAGFSFFRHRTAIESSVYRPSTWANLVLTVLAAGGGGAILVYLLRS